MKRNMAELEEQVTALLSPFGGQDARCHCEHGVTAHVWFEDDDRSEPFVDGCGQCVCGQFIVLTGGTADPSI